MLIQLRIQNYAIIDQIQIDFSEKLNVITGETGAGKSILAGALALILGERADTSVLLHRDKKCVVEGVFEIENKIAVANFLEQNDLDVDAELVLRREIGSNGKSRAFVNDTPVNLEQMRALSALLVDLHQQFDTLELGQSDFQREVLDALAGNGSVLHGYQMIYRQWSSANKDLIALLESQLHADKEADYNKFLLSELNEAGFRENELEELDSELKLLSNAENIKAALSKIYYEFEEAEQPLVQQLKSSLHQLQPFSSFHPDLPKLLARLESAQIELKDIASEIEHINAHVPDDPRRIGHINDRLSVGYKLLKKHALGSTNELLRLKKELENKLQIIFDIAESIQTKQREADQLLAESKQLAETISRNRQGQIKKLEQKVNDLLIQVGMPNASMKVQLQQHELGPFGKDAIEFLFDANKSGRFDPIRKVASGGELSRLMLCIKSLVAQSIDLPTLLFDEIDSGISGEAAKQVGIILRDLSKNRQVICITHQPQIASKADAHYFVYKVAEGGTVNTNLRKLSADERIITIAKMLSGEKPTAAALENAREMVTH